MTGTMLLGAAVFCVLASWATATVFRTLRAWIHNGPADPAEVVEEAEHGR